MVEMDHVCKIGVGVGVYTGRDCFEKRAPDIGTNSFRGLIGSRNQSAS